MNQLQRAARLENIETRLNAKKQLPPEVKSALVTLLLAVFDFLYKYYFDSDGKRQGLLSTVKTLMSEEFRKDLGYLKKIVHNVIDEV